MPVQTPAPILAAGPLPAASCRPRRRCCHHPCAKRAAQNGAEAAVGLLLPLPLGAGGEGGGESDGTDRGDSAADEGVLLCDVVRLLLPDLGARSEDLFHQIDPDAVGASWMATRSSQGMRRSLVMLSLIFSATSRSAFSSSICGADGLLAGGRQCSRG